MLDVVSATKRHREHKRGESEQKEAKEAKVLAAAKVAAVGFYSVASDLRPLTSAREEGRF